MSSVKWIRILLMFLFANLLLTIPNITAQEGVYIGVFALLMVLFRKKRHIFYAAIMVLFTCLILQLNEFRPDLIQYQNQGYWALNVGVNLANGVIFVILMIVWFRGVDLLRIRKAFFDEFGLAVLTTFVILFGYFMVRFFLIWFEPRELLFLFELFEAAIVTIIIRDTFLLREQPHPKGV